MKKTVTKTIEYSYESYETESDDLLEKMIADAKADVSLVNGIKAQNKALAEDMLVEIKEMVKKSKYLNTLGLNVTEGNVYIHESVRYMSSVSLKDDDYTSIMKIYAISQPGEKFKDSEGNIYRLACDYKIAFEHLSRGIKDNNMSLDGFLEKLEEDHRFMSSIIKKKIKEGLL